MRKLRMDAVPRARFFEQFYLKNNPDVAEAVAAGDFSSGLDHWILHGQHEARIVCLKADIINHLAHTRGYQSYLEIAPRLQAAVMLTLIDQNTKPVIDQCIGVQMTLTMEWESIFVALILRSPVA